MVELYVLGESSPERFYNQNGRMFSRRWSLDVHAYAWRHLTKFVNTTYSLFLTSQLMYQQTGACKRAFTIRTPLAATLLSIPFYLIDLN